MTARESRVDSNVWHALELRCSQERPAAPSALTPTRARPQHIDGKAWWSLGLSGAGVHMCISELWAALAGGTKLQPRPARSSPGRRAGWQTRLKSTPPARLSAPEPRRSTGPSPTSDSTGARLCGRGGASAATGTRRWCKTSSGALLIPALMSGDMRHPPCTPSRPALHCQMLDLTKNESIGRLVWRTPLRV